MMRNLVTDAHAAYSKWHKEKTRLRNRREAAARGRLAERVREIIGTDYPLRPVLGRVAVSYSDPGSALKLIFSRWEQYRVAVAVQGDNRSPCPVRGLEDIGYVIDTAFDA